MSILGKKAIVTIAASVVCAGLVPSVASAATDTTPPTVPQNLQTAAAPLSSANPVIRWDASTDTETGVFHYWVLVDGAQRAKPAGTSYDIQTLVNLGRITAGPHAITVLAVDFALNRSAPSEPVNIVVVK
jgi:hypothetical protein